MATRPPPLPRVCSSLRIYRDTEVARGEFRKRRLDDPLADYNQKFPNAKTAADAVIDALAQITTFPSDRALLASLVGDKSSYAALRSLAAPPISKDDLETLVRESVNKTKLRKNQALSDNLISLIKDCLDPQRFPWVVESRAATPEEIAQAKLATAVLTAMSAVQAGRRGDERKQLEGAVKAILADAGFEYVQRPREGIRSPGQLPAPGKYMTTCTLGDHNADFVIGLWDTRIMPLECKASNSEVNGRKRLNKEVVVDAGDWIRRFGSDTIVAAAALRGVFDPKLVAQAQSAGVHIFWWHRLRSLRKFLDDTRP